MLFRSRRTSSYLRKITFSGCLSLASQYSAVARQAGLHQLRPLTEHLDELVEVEVVEPDG